jgi:hypothetical protein
VLEFGLAGGDRRVIKARGAEQGAQAALAKVNRQWKKN